MAVTSPYAYVPERDDSFLSLFPHRYDYIYAPHANPHDRPQWQTESRYPLSDRLIQQGAYLYGVRFGQQTHYCLLDIDIGSAYHPRQDSLAVSRIISALEPLGLVSYVACTSSYSKGLHLYFPFETAQNSWQLSAVVTTLLENGGFTCQPGQLEVFPNKKLYVVDGTPNLFNAHRLPLQDGSYLLGPTLAPINGGWNRFVHQWRHCQQRNTIDDSTIQRVLKQTQRQRHCVSQRADKFLNDLNAEIEPGWTGKGQTNYLLGRIAMRSYIFHHVMHGGLPLSGDLLVEAIVSTATSLPGYRDWCGHQHEIHQRAEEWARCVENSHYFPYGSQHGKYKAKTDAAESTAYVENTWNQQRSQTAQQKIQIAMAELVDTDQLPATVTARFKKLVAYGIGGSTLYKYKPLWHPDLWKPPQTPELSNQEAVAAMASPATPSLPASLLPGNDSNASGDAALSDPDKPSVAAGVRNGLPPTVWQQVLLDLKARQFQQKQAQRSRRQAQIAPIRPRDAHSQAKTMRDYLRSRDPILMKEGLQWLVQQQEVPLQQVLPQSFDGWSRTETRLAGLIEVCELLLELQWPPPEIAHRLQAEFGQSGVAPLSFGQLWQWRDYLYQHAVLARQAQSDSSQ